MLDKLNTKIVKVLNGMCDNSSTYKILSLNDIIQKVGKNFNIDVESLTKNLEFLSSRDYIDVKYIDEKDVCLALLSKARIHDEELEGIRKEKNKYYKLATFSAVMSALAAFLGAFLAIVLFK